MLVVFGGLPGTGKTTIAREVARRQGALYLRIDTIEHSIQAGVPGGGIGIAGYAVALALARENLSVGQVVVADAVNPVPEARDAWRDTATRLSIRLIEIEIVCSDALEHRRRVDARRTAWEAGQNALGDPAMAGPAPPAWDDVLKRHYVPWNEDHWVINTALSSAAEAVAAICARLSAAGSAET